MKKNKWVLTALMLWCSAALAQRDSVGKVLDIGNNSDYEGYEMLDSLLAIKKLFVVGENYDYAAFNSKIEFKLLRYMNHKSGLRNYLIEVSPAKADLINQYIGTEDSAVEKLLQSVSKVKYMRLYKNLKRLNASLADSLKIRVFGVDVERSNTLPVVKMSQYLPEDSIPDHLRISVEAIKGAAKYVITQGLEEYDREKEADDNEYDDYYYRPSAFSVRQSLEEFLKTYDTLEDDFQRWLGPKFKDFNQAVDWLKEYKEYYRYSMTALEYTWRDELIFKHVNDLLAKYPNEKFYGQFGMCRTTYSRVPKGCGINSFGGMVYKLKTYSESNAPDVVSIGLFYKDELDIGYNSVDDQHQQYQSELEYMFELVADEEAAIADLSEFDTAFKLQNDFSLLILNNGYIMADDSETEADTSVAYDTEDNDSDWYNDYRNSRIYLGAHAFTPFINIGDMNTQLKAGGLDTVSNVNYINGEMAVATDRMVFSLFYSAGNTLAGNYSTYAAGFKGGSCLVFSRFLKLGLFTTYAFVQHKITDKSASNSQTFISEYIPPKVFVNPSVTLGLSLDAYVDLSPFYIYGAAGRQWDMGKSNWKNKGFVTGEKGGLSNTAWFTNIGLGLSIPLKWID